QIDGVKTRGGKLHRLAHPDIEYVAVPGKPSAVKIQEQSLSRTPQSVIVPPYSMSIYSLRVVR
ncbi:MAG: hypothetical protein GX535_18135, partial [Xanthomonadaceae bacterium]|nr:hypothetical protein [Xanthomonadaceae bacterium]